MDPLMATTLSPTGSSWHDASGGPPFPFVVIPLFWILVLAALAAVVVTSRRRHEGRAGTRAGEAVLAERYARGEIDAEDYAARLDVLRRR